MKKILISNQEIRMGYEFSDLSEDVQNSILDEQIEFEICFMDEESPYYQLALKMERMQTPWFLGQEIYHNHKSDLIETININNYLFSEDGDILPVTYHVSKNNKIVKTTYGKLAYDCKIENI